jgi:co-chaperonin GroES (HSP10)
MNIKPIKDQVVVLADPRPEKIGLIIVPDVAAMDNPNWFPETGRVVALGRTAYSADGEDEQPFDVAVGDRVHFNRYAGKQVTCSDDGVTYLVMRAHEIDLVLDDGHTVFHGYQPATESEILSWDHDPLADR